MFISFFANISSCVVYKNSSAYCSGSYCVFAQEIKLKNTKQSPEVVTFVKKHK